VSLLSLLLLLFVILPCCAAAEEETLVWFRCNSPPLSIVSGPNKERGAIDLWGHYFTEHLTEFHHKIVLANVVRLQEEIKHHDNACSWAVIKTPEREKFLIFSERLTELLPNGFITLQSRRAELEAYLDENGALRLSELIATGKFQIGVASGRSFGPQIDAILHSEQAKNSVRPFAAFDIFSTGLLQVANRQTLDAVLGYAVEMAYAVSHISRSPTQFLFLPIAEDTQLTPIHIACSRSPLGERVISRANELIRAGADEFATDAYRSWLPMEIRPYYDNLRKAQAHGLIQQK